eukprot:tig00001604_g9410.t1
MRPRTSDHGARAMELARRSPRPRTDAPVAAPVYRTPRVMCDAGAAASASSSGGGGGGGGGRVWIVGAGPGDADLITLRGLRALRAADAVVYDALASPELLDETREGCELHAAGKRGGEESAAQGEIDALLVRLCRAGKRVVRLKAGDPFVFGRSHFEARPARPAPVAPPTAAPQSEGARRPPPSPPPPALRGPPRPAHSPPRPSRAVDRAGGLVGAGGPRPRRHPPHPHRAQPELRGGVGARRGALDLPALARMDAAAFLMAGRALPELMEGLVGAGLDPATPVAVIRWAGRPDQRVWEGTAGSIVGATAGERLSPCVVVVGRVVALRALFAPPAPQREAEVGA